MDSADVARPGTRRSRRDPTGRIRSRRWRGSGAGRSAGFNDHLVIALQGESALRLLSGLLTIYLAFYIEATVHGLEAAIQLGAVIGAAGLGNFSGTAIGTKVKLRTSRSAHHRLGRHREQRPV